MARSWIKLHRQFIRSPILKHAGLCQLWVYCLMRANWRESKVLLGTKQVVVPRGGFITGRFELHSALYEKKRKNKKRTRHSVCAPSESTLWRWLQSLELMGCITVENLNNMASLVTVCKYSTYQDDDRDNEQRMNNVCTTDEQPVNNVCTTDEQRMNTVEEGEEYKEEEELEEREEVLAATSASATPELIKPKPKRKPRANRAPRARNPLFDAIVEISGADPTMNGSHIGSLAADLSKSATPYSPEDVREFGRRFHSLCGWAVDQDMQRPTIGTIRNHIYLVRQVATEKPRKTQAEWDEEIRKEQELNALLASR